MSVNRAVFWIFFVAFPLGVAVALIAIGASDPTVFPLMAPWLQIVWGVGLLACVVLAFLTMLLGVFEVIATPDGAEARTTYWLPDWSWGIVLAIFVLLVLVTVVAGFAG